jgi:hypothetical protein
MIEKVNKLDKEGELPTHLKRAISGALAGGISVLVN